VPWFTDSLVDGLVIDRFVIDRFVIHEVLMSAGR